MNHAQIQERVRANTTVDENGCWVWTRPLDHYGYARFSVGGKDVKVHRASYEAHVGPIPAGLVIDHLCRNRACQNPAHMEPVTRVENTLRGEGFVARNKRLSHCKNGHPYDEANTYLRPANKGRDCRKCNAAAVARYAASRAARA